MTKKSGWLPSRSLHVLDTPPEERFDRITRLATELFSVPISFVSLIDEDRVWHKSKKGLGLTPKCLARTRSAAHAILDPGTTMVIADASVDARFHDNPLVTGDPNIRFYAGQPLVSPDGHALGTFCIIWTAWRIRSATSNAPLCATSPRWPRPN